MDCTCNKKYNARNCKSRSQVETFFSRKLNLGLASEIMYFPVQCILQAVAQGLITGGTLIEAACGSFLHLSGSLNGTFSTITLLRFSDECVMEVKNWLNNVPEAYDWLKMGSMMKDAVGYGPSIEEAEKRFKLAVKSVLKCDMKNYNIADPVELSPADCVLVAGAVEIGCQNEEEFSRNMGKFTRMVKSGGQFVFIGLLGASSFEVDGVMYPVFSCNENIVKNAITNQGLTILQCKIHKSTNPCDSINHQAIIFITAKKSSY